MLCKYVKLFCLMLPSRLTLLSQTRGQLSRFCQATQKMLTLLTNSSRVQLVTDQRSEIKFANSNLPSLLVDGQSF